MNINTPTTVDMNIEKLGKDYHLDGYVFVGDNDYRNFKCISESLFVCMNKFEDFVMEVDAA